MNDLREQELVELVHRYYPQGPFHRADGYSQDSPPYTRTAQHQNWVGAWKRAMEWPEWDTLLEQLDSQLGGVGDVTQPYMAACRRCSKAVTFSSPEGAQRIVRAVAAVSVLAPLYITYCIPDTAPGAPDVPRFTFEPTDEVRPYTATLAQSIERVLGYRPFPIHLATVRLPGLFVPHGSGEQATLLDALFDRQLDNVP
jgi:ribosome modulation factor